MSAMTARGTRGVGLIAALAAATLALAAAPAWGASARGVSESAGANAPRTAKLNAARLGPVRKGNGIVQGVRAHALVVRLLDGQKLVVPVGPRTAVFVNGVRSSLDQITPGSVVTFVARAAGAAVEVRARSVSAASPTPAATVVQSVSADAVVVTRPNGATVTIPVRPRTRVFLNGSPVTIADVRPGDVLGKVGARALRFRRPG
jgi:hypothetical protein